MEKTTEETLPPTVLPPTVVVDENFPPPVPKVLLWRSLCGTKAARLILPEDIKLEWELIEG
jgi:hypothetical protein